MHGIESTLALALVSEDARPLWIHHSFPWIELRYLTLQHGNYEVTENLPVPSRR